MIREVHHVTWRDPTAAKMTSHDSSENIHCLLYTALIQLEYLEAILCRDRDLSLSLGVIPVRER